HGCSGRDGGLDAVSARQQVSLIHVLDLPFPPSPAAPPALAVDLTRYPSPRRVSRSRGSRLHLSPAGSPTLTGRIEFVILRMDRSPPAAPHPASRRRSSSWLQAGERMPEEDLHLSDQTRFQAHWNARSVARSKSVRRSARSTWSVSRQKLARADSKSNHYTDS